MAMDDMTIGLRVRVKAGVTRGERLSFTFDGKPITALLAAGERTLRITAQKGAARGVFCGMGVCYDCMVVIDGEPSRRACTTLATEGMEVETLVGYGASR
jgi:aerobic-type carbon monoxide dehydrogenase small subunit (CoxS/CutS family)